MINNCGSPAHEEGNAKEWFDSSFIVTAAGLAFAGLLGWIANSAIRKDPAVAAEGKERST
ncbi:MAG: hypothetical protein M3Y55_08250 [Pseudomonadota bacterium]|nr:hypothetical protein [Pseudomonadota bacterium]